MSNFCLFLGSFDGEEGGKHVLRLDLETRSAGVKGADRTNGWNQFQFFEGGLKNMVSGKTLCWLRGGVGCVVCVCV